MCMCAYSLPPSKVIICLQNHFIVIFAMKRKPSETCTTSDVTGYKHFFVFKKKTVRGCINMFRVIFVSPKFYSVFKRVRMYIVGY